MKTNIAREYRRKHPEMPTLKLARIMYAENQLSFKDVEDARYVLRRIEGKTSHKKYKGDAEEFHVEHRPKNPYKLPESSVFRLKAF